MDASIKGTTFGKVGAKDLRAQAEHCNDMKLKAKKAGEASEEMYLGLFVSQCGPINNISGIVVDVRSSTFVALKRF